MANGSADDERSAIRACHTAGASIAFGLCKARRDFRVTINAEDFLNE
jgi:hypothetical protein